MKKLMIATLAVAAAGGAFADPLVYDYKATVKHMYEKEAKSGTLDVYVKYVKSSKLQGYFIQDIDGDTLLANQDLTGSNPKSEKKGFLVLINKSAEKDYRAPKIMPAQLDVKAVVSKSTSKGGTTTTKSSVEAYFYAGPFGAFPDATNPWDASYDGGADYMFNNGAAAPGVGVRAYGTVGSTLYLFGQHNTYNKYNNDAAATPAYTPAALRAFGDAWMNGAGFGTAGGKSSLCCGWGVGSSSFGSISGSLKGGLFLCSISGNPLNAPALGGYFTLGLEDVYKNDVNAALGRTVQGDDPTASEDADLKAWSDGELTLSTTDVVTGSWTLKPSSSKFKPEVLSSSEENMIDTTWGNGSRAVFQNVLEYVKGASKKLDKSYDLLTNTEPSALNGKPSRGLISKDFLALYFGV